jgi:hypothetical protein
LDRESLKDIRTIEVVENTQNERRKFRKDFEFYEWNVESMQGMMKVETIFIGKNSSNWLILYRSEICWSNWINNLKNEENNNE